MLVIPHPFSPEGDIVSTKVNAAHAIYMDVPAMHNTTNKALRRLCVHMTLN